MDLHTHTHTKAHNKNLLLRSMFAIAKMLLQQKFTTSLLCHWPPDDACVVVFVSTLTLHQKQKKTYTQTRLYLHDVV